MSVSSRLVRLFSIMILSPHFSVDTIRLEAGIGVWYGSWEGDIVESAQKVIFKEDGDSIAMNIRKLQMATREHTEDK